jgi:asparagine synthase (glutamine-hydrolysing)
MCGISGFVDKKNILSDIEKKEIALKMVNMLMYRGSDDYDYLIKNKVVMAHNRLSIIDISKKSKQPIVNNIGALTYNGEIYNYKNFDDINSYSDTIFLLDFLSKSQDIQKLDGMFAYAFQNYSEKKLYLQVDRFGIKPLYWYEDDNFFAWGSELKVFLNLPGMKFIFNENQLEDFMLYRTNTTSETLIKNVFRMPPGESLTFDLARQEIVERKISVSFLKETEPNNSKKLDPYEIIKNDIKNSLIADVPVGIQLSGGIDSTLVAAVSSIYKDNIHTYSIGMEDDEWNEFRFSDMVAKKIKSTHKKILFSKKDFIDNFNKVTYLLDEPINHENTVPMYLLSKEARKDVKVLLTGEGADELLGGYRRYSSLSSKEKFNKINDEEAVRKILINAKDVNYRETIWGDSEKFSDPVQKYSYFDIKTFLPSVLLRQDKASMGANIESRVPFLCNSSSKALFNLNQNEKNGEFGQKNILKKILFDRFGFDFDFLTRRKCGFGLPLKNWLKDEDVFLKYLLNITEHELILSHFNVKEIQIIINDHINDTSDNTDILFTLVSLATWYDIFISKDKFI